MSSKYLEISRVSKVFASKHSAQVVVKDFDLSVSQGEFVSLIGHSGCGKSTVLAMLAGLQSTSGGGIILAGREVTAPGPDRGVVFQAPSLLHWMTVLDNVLLGVQQAHPNKGPVERTEIARHYLSLVGLGDSLDKKPAALSAGMRQRVGLARAFALTPRLLLLDEPFGMLDSLTRIELQDVLIELWAQDKKTAVMVTHDVDEALFLSDRVVMMTPGPEAKVGEILHVPFERPRSRRQTMDDPRYYPLRECIIGFLETQAEHRDQSPEAVAGAVT